MGKAAASSPDYGAEPVRRKGVFARLFRKKPAPATDAFGGGAEAAAASLQASNGRRVLVPPVKEST